MLAPARSSRSLSVALLLTLGLAACDRTPGLVAAKAAAEKGDIQVSAQGIGLDSMSVTVTSIRNDTIVLPAGTRFNSNNAGTQNMMAAATVTFAFSNATPQAPQIITQPVPVYCLNRFLDVPTSAVSFSVSYTEETDPLRLLAECLESKNAEHEVKQLAVWMVSDSLMELSREDVAAKFLDDMEKNWRETWSSGERAAEEIEIQDPDADPEFLERVRQMTPEDLEELAGLIRPTLRSRAEAQVRRYVDQTTGLLESCGYDLTTKRFFRDD